MLRGKLVSSNMPLKLDRRLTEPKQEPSHCHTPLYSGCNDSFNKSFTNVPLISSLSSSVSLSPCSAPFHLIFNFAFIWISPMSSDPCCLTSYQFNSSHSSSSSLLHPLCPVRSPPPMFRFSRDRNAVCFCKSFRLGSSRKIRIWGFSRPSVNSNQLTICSPDQFGQIK